MGGETSPVTTTVTDSSSTAIPSSTRPDLRMERPWMERARASRSRSPKRRPISAAWAAVLAAPSGLPFMTSCSYATGTRRKPCSAQSSSSSSSAEPWATHAEQAAHGGRQTSDRLGDLAGPDLIEPDPGSTTRRPAEVTLVDVDLIGPQPRLTAVLRMAAKKRSGRQQLQIRCCQSRLGVDLAQRLVSVKPTALHGGLASAFKCADASRRVDTHGLSPQARMGSHRGRVLADGSALAATAGRGPVAACPRAQ